MNRLICSLPVALLAAVLARNLEAAESAPAATGASIGILTPGVPAGLTFGNSQDSFGQLTAGLTSSATTKSSKELTDQASAAGFNATDLLSKHLEEAFAARSLPTSRIDVQRRIGAHSAGLARGDIPRTLPEGVARLLDVTVSLMGLDRRYGLIEPYIFVTYRVLSPSGQTEQAVRAVNVNTLPAQLKASVASWGTKPPDEALKMGEGCQLMIRYSPETDGPKLWKCLDDALAAIATQIAADPVWAAARPRGTSLD